ncbi:MAG TPA: hypothetical protein DCY48_03595 [Candidatus Magasanikbacteria bacterium]|nr:MAG: hypothetical protein A3I74_04680 [Candidatus Magasanikbacteria bacterium RIFCSPLOWO2_02_FULL_47_16]OGH79501.1 MAG: hypothetical protein A3C10_01650 [Candidatus Magasanikbacteria bacterium RIFCSPHIGHO2_02_FULL_48_18]HAZ28828.1 hypothetical protein [Candidatus Magasanikbacteria bacterium]
MKRSNKKRSGTFPDEFSNRLSSVFGASRVGGVLATLIEKPTTFRWNPLKGLSRSDVADGLRGLGFHLRPVPWYPDAWILENKSKRDLVENELYTDGHIYVQSLASMVPPLVLDPKPGERVLDLTAAPGSKTSQIAALMRQEGELVANDNNKPRFFKLKHNLEHLGVLREAPGWRVELRLEHGTKLCQEYPAYFDKILLDAPCSAEARFIAADPKTYGFWKERKIKEMAYKQRQLLFAAWSALKPGGTLVYSTCTFAPEENECQISRLLERHKKDASLLDISLSGHGLKRGPVTTIWKEKSLHPDIQQCFRVEPAKEIEGFFMAKLQKQNDTTEE